MARQAARLCARAASDAVGRWVEDSGGVEAWVCGVAMAQGSRSREIARRGRCRGDRFQRSSRGLKGEVWKRGDWE